MAKKYIYRTEYLQWDASDDVLNSLGQEGWELVSVVSKSLNYVEQSSGIPNPLDFLSPDNQVVEKKDLKTIKAFFKKELISWEKFISSRNKNKTFLQQSPVDALNVRYS